MSEPFNASTVSKTLYGKNNLEVTFVDQECNTIQVVNLSPAARRNLMLGLLARPPLPPEGEALLLERERILNVAGIRVHGLPDGNPVIELLLAKEMSIYLTFPKEGIKAFQEALALLEKKLIASQSH